LFGNEIEAEGGFNLPENTDNTPDRIELNFVGAFAAGALTIKSLILNGSVSIVFVLGRLTLQNQILIHH